MSEQVKKRPTFWVLAAVLSWPVYWLLVYTGQSHVLDAHPYRTIWNEALLLALVTAVLVPPIICGMKNKWIFLAVTIVGMFALASIGARLYLFFAMYTLATVGAIRIAKPNSAWARKYYGKDKMMVALWRFPLARQRTA